MPPKMADAENVGLPRCTSTGRRGRQRIEARCFNQALCSQALVKLPDCALPCPSRKHDRLRACPEGVSRQSRSVVLEASTGREQRKTHLKGKQMS